MPILWYFNSDGWNVFTSIVALGGKLLSSWRNMVHSSSISLPLSIQVETSILSYAQYLTVIINLPTLVNSLFHSKFYELLRLYGQWKSDTYIQHPPLMRKKADIQKRSKGIMQRISKENVKPTSRKIGKVTNSSPVLLFDYVCIIPIHTQYTDVYPIVLKNVYLLMSWLSGIITNSALW